ncbi:MAG TPA: hypothetical protein VFB19_21060 [Mycobacterium sp.]|nr:hypothetical protein [Mycobacterium sp.]
MTAAGIIAIIWGAFSLLYGLVGAFFAWMTSQEDRRTGTRMETFGSTSTAANYIWAIAVIILSGAMIWGGIVALRGRTNKVLVVSAVVLVVVNIISLILFASTGSGSFAPPILGIVLPCLLFALVRTQQAKQWFLARGGVAI